VKGALVPEWLAPYVLSFVPLFAAIDPVGMTPFYLSAVEGRPAAARRRVLSHAMVTALVAGLAFIFLGERVLRLLGVTVPDFAIAGGLLLLVIAVADLVMHDKVHKRTASGPPEEEDETAGVVPLGVPLIVGPATVTTSVVLLDRYGTLPCVTAFVSNIALAGLAFWQSERLLRLLGRAGARAVSKLVSLLLAAIAVKLIRVGIEATLESWGR
jgi:multiple antibiotic resistance protein